MSAELNGSSEANIGYSNSAGADVSSDAANADFMAQAMDEYEAPSEDDARLIELVGFLVQGVVSHPQEVEVEEFLDDQGSIYGIRVHPDDVGRVIGREGRVANALRHVVKAAATKTGARVQVEIITDDEPMEIADSAESSGESSTGNGGETR